MRGKRTPRKNLKHGPKRVSKSISDELGEDSRHSPGGLDFEPVTTLQAEDTETGDVSDPVLIILFTFWISITLVYRTFIISILMNVITQTIKWSVQSYPIGIINLHGLGWSVRASLLHNFDC